jgi:hypothetical protein
LDVGAKSVLRKISGPKKEEITTDKKKLHEKCHDMYSPQTFHKGDEIQDRQSMWQTQRNRYSGMFLDGQPSWKELTGKVYVYIT